MVLNEGTVGKRVLAIDGGGFRGLSCLVMLNHLMDILNRNENTLLLPCDVFDLICGTSTGGFIAILLGRLGLDCTAAISVYKELGLILFDQTQVEATVTTDPSNALAEKLTAIVERYTGFKATLLKLPKASHHSENLHKSTDVFITTVHSASTSGVEPHRLRSYATPFGAVDSVPNHKWTIVDAIHAALASLTCHEPFSIGSYAFQDASNSGVANPVLEALSEVRLRWGNEIEPVMISVGTGLVSLASINPSLTYEPRRRSGYLGKLQRWVKKTNPDPKAWSDAFAKQLRRVAQDTEHTHREARMHFREQDLSGKYFRFNPTSGLGDMEMSDIGPTAYAKIVALTNSWLGTNEGQGMVERATKALRAGIAYDEDENIIHPCGRDSIISDRSI